MKKILQKVRYDSFYKDLLVTFIGQTVVMILSFILNKIVSNEYTVELFGTYNIIRRFISVISFVMLMALGIAIPKLVAESRAQGKKIYIESYMISSLFIMFFAFISILIIVGGLSELFGKVIFGDRNASVYLYPSCLYALGSCLITYAYSFYRGINEFVRYNIINIIMQIGIITISLLISNSLFWLYTIWGVFLVTYGIFEIVVIYKKNNFNFTNLRSKLFTLKYLLKYCLPRVPGEFILFAFNLIPLTIITNKFGMAEVGYFSAALTINSIITPFFSLVGTILLPLVSKSAIDNTQEKVKRKIQILGFIYLVVGLIGVFFVYCFGNIILTVLFNKDYVVCIPIIKLTILSVIPNAIYLLLRNPIDGISVFPYNTFGLIVSFIVYIIMLLLSKTVKMCAISLIVSHVVLGGFSLGVWIKISKNNNKNID